MSLEVLKFSASWCGPCRVLAQTLKDVEGITNIDIEKDQETARKPWNLERLCVMTWTWTDS